MADQRLADLGRRIRAAETKHRDKINAYTTNQVRQQIENFGTAMAVVRVEVVDGKVYVGPLYPSAPQPEEWQ